MKILQVISSLGNGGAETIVTDYAINMKMMGNDVRVATVYKRTGSKNEDRLNNENVEVNYLSPESLVDMEAKWYHKATSLLLIVWRYVAFLHLLWTFKPDVIHMHTGGMAFVAHIPSRLLNNFKLFYTCHSVPAVYFSNGKSKKPLRKLIRHGVKIIALHSEMREQLKEMFGTSNIIVLHNGCNISSYHDNSDVKSIVRLSMNIPEDSFVIGHIGRFVEVKNHRFIVKIAKEAIRYNSNLFFMFIGYGPLKEEIMNTFHANDSLKNRCLFLENRSDISRLLRTMDCFILPSFYEGFPVTLIEAQAAGVHCVFSDKITKDAVLSDNAVRLSLEDPIDKWISEIYNVGKDEPSIKVLNEFDAFEIARKLCDEYNKPM